MSVWAVSMVKDEADIVEASVGRMARQVDGVIVADNGSTDGTRAILEGLGVEIVDDPDPAYQQSAKMSRLAAMAGERGAEWIVPFDADEIWSAHGKPIAHVLRELPDWVLICEAAIFDHVGIEGEGTPLERMRWRRRDPLPLPKVACRYRDGLVIHQGNHGASFPDEPLPPIVKHLLSIRHFPYRSAGQMIRKARNGAAAYAATDLPEEVGAHWRGYGRLTDEQITEVFHEHFASADPDNDPALILDPCP